MRIDCLYKVPHLTEKHGEILERRYLVIPAWKQGSSGQGCQTFASCSLDSCFYAGMMSQLKLI